MAAAHLFHTREPNPSCRHNGQRPANDAPTARHNGARPAAGRRLWPRHWANDRARRPALLRTSAVIQSGHSKAGAATFGDPRPGRTKDFLLRAWPAGRRQWEIGPVFALV